MPYIFTQNNPFFASLLWYARYIDYLLFIWRSDVTTIPEQSDYFNNNFFDLRFMFAFSLTVINFLDRILFGNVLTNNTDTKNLQQRYRNK